MNSFTFDLMLADKGGMISSDNGRTAFEDDKKLQVELGKYITEVMIADGNCDAKITIQIDYGTD